MANIRKRKLPSGAIRFLVDYVDMNGRRRAKQFAKRKDAEAWMHRSAVEVMEGRQVADRDSPTVSKVAELWLAYCEAEMAAGRFEGFEAGEWR